ncbi:unnamed protein product [marine sediment metagenome]|uniref:Uncharacterized protein n=1 Tax=marine sediment metagenome TaxID=412755 RepID=X1EN53_9ZZZZ
MENLPFSFITIPIVADLSVGLRWGALKDIKGFDEIDIEELTKLSKESLKITKEKFEERG